MTALDTILNILSIEPLVDANLKYCFHKGKVPYNGTSLAKPDLLTDFIDLHKLDLFIAEKYDGVGISIQASNVSAIDVDHCFHRPFDFDSVDDRGKDIYNLFKNLAYIEFSYSGKGMRILFKSKEIKNYTKTYMVKNSSTNCEFYYPEGSNRYVTLTGKSIAKNDITFIPEETILSFLNKYMLRPNRPKMVPKMPPRDDIEIDQLLLHYIRSDKGFQDVWFSVPSGSGGNESECDYFLLGFIFNNITKNSEQAKEIFESSFYFKHKDRKHIRKWEYNDFRYFNYIWSRLNE